MLSIRLRTRLSEIGLALAVIIFVWLLQTNVLARLSLGGLLANLPLTFTIVWGSVFGSRLHALSSDELRTLSISEVIVYQALSGSLSGAITGALFAGLYASVLPVYPVSYALIGWIAGYFTLKRVNQAALLSIPLVLCASMLAELFMSLQLSSMGRPQVLSRFVQAALPEAALNAMIAPLIFIPMRRWYEFWTSKREVAIE